MFGGDVVDTNPDTFGVEAVGRMELDQELDFTFPTAESIQPSLQFGSRLPDMGPFNSDLLREAFVASVASDILQSPTFAPYNPHTIHRVETFNKQADFDPLINFSLLTAPTEFGKQGPPSDAPFSSNGWGEQSEW